MAIDKKTYRKLFDEGRFGELHTLVREDRIRNMFRPLPQSELDNMSEKSLHNYRLDLREWKEMQREEGRSPAKMPRRSKKKHPKRGFTGNFGRHEVPLEEFKRMARAPRGQTNQKEIAPMATKRATKRTSTKRVKRAVKRPANQTLHRARRGTKGANLAVAGGAAKKPARRRSSSRELMTEKRPPWKNALGQVRVKTPSKPGDETYANKVQFDVILPSGKEKTVYHKARAKALHDRGAQVLARPRVRPEHDPRSKLYAGKVTKRRAAR